MKKNNKGFTLTELIIVIVIIGILAAVLIPSLTGYVQKARRSNDVQLAAEMTKEIGLYCIENDCNQNNLIGTDVRSILLFRGYDLEPRTNKWTFVYNGQKKIVEIVDIEDGVLAAWDISNAVDPTNYQENMFIIGKGKNQFEKAIDLLCNMTSLLDYDEAVQLVNGSTQFTSLLNLFNPTNTMYVNNNSVMTECSTSNGVSRIVYIEKTVNLPKISEIQSNYLNANATSTKSTILKTVETGSSFNTVYPKLKDTSEIEVFEIDLDFKTEGSNYIPSVTLGIYVTNSLIQDFCDEIVNQSIDGNVLTTNRKFVVSYYNGKGLYARGIKYYNTVQTVE